MFWRNPNGGNWIVSHPPLGTYTTPKAPSCSARRQFIELELPNFFIPVWQSPTTALELFGSAWVFHDAIQ